MDITFLYIHISGKNIPMNPEMSIVREQHFPAALPMRWKIPCGCAMKAAPVCFSRCCEGAHRGARDARFHASAVPASACIRQ
jgi:hypothetical protein